MKSEVSASISNADILSASALSAKKKKKRGIVETRDDIATLDDLKQIKDLMQSKVGIPFCTNVLRVALNMKEERIASFVVWWYQVYIDERMITRAVKTA
jgi:hypothetical protein